MHNRSQGAFLYTIEYVKYLSTYLKGTWKVVRYTNKCMEEPHDPWDAVQEINENSYV